MSTQTPPPEPAGTPAEEKPPTLPTPVRECASWARSRPQLCMLVPAALIPVMAALVIRRRRSAGKRGRGASVDWRFLSTNNVIFSPRLNFHPTVQLGRRRSR